MAKTVFVLGAGASAQAGAPLMNTFLDRARDLLAAGKVDDKRDDFERVFKALVELRVVFFKSGLDLDNIEPVFGAFEMARIIGKLGDYSKEEIDKCANSIRVLIVRTLEESVRYNYIFKSDASERDDLRPSESYQGFVNQLKLINKRNRESGLPSNCSVLTFNYDIAIDYAFTYLEVPQDYCLKAVTGGNEVKLLKLHGSLNWGKCQSCNKITAVPLSKERILKFAREHATGSIMTKVTIPTSQDLVSTECADANCGTHLSNEPVIVPPTWNKTQGHTELTNVWKQAAIELGEAENIICIGYSLPESDLFFRYLFALGTIGEAHLRKFWVFDPDPQGVVKERFARLIGKGIERRFKFFNGNEGRFYEAIKNHIYL